MLFLIQCHRQLFLAFQLVDWMVLFWFSAVRDNNSDEVLKKLIWCKINTFA
jgi:hypothetical protein